jgi:hypothetical protein
LQAGFAHDFRFSIAAQPDPKAFPYTAEAPSSREQQEIPVKVQTA